MDYGRFFMVHPEADVTRKSVLFFYLPLRGAKGSRFPIYLAFYQNKINFYFDGQLKFKEDKEEDDTINNKYSLSESDLILSLDLTPDPVSQERLNNLLADTFKREFPISNVDIDIKNIKKTNKTLYDVCYYKDLEVFNNNNLPTKKISYKDLILDFLFDASRENSVFSVCKQFAHIKYLMNQSFFLTALMRKAEFYYLVENYKHKNNPSFVFSELYPKKNRENEKDFTDVYKKRLIKAQELWLETLQQPGSHKVINKNNHWFDDVETETEKVFTKIKDKITDKQKNETENQKYIDYKEKLEKHKKNSIKWFFSRSALYKGWGVTLNYSNIFVAVFIIIIYFLLIILFITRNLFLVVSLTFAIYLIVAIYYASKRYLLELLLLRFIFLVAGATYFAFEIAHHFNYYLVKNSWTTFRLNFSFISNWGLIGFSLVILGSSYFILLDNEKKNHPKLPSRVSNRKVFVLMIFILSLSSLFNVMWMNNFHFRKELFEENLVIDQIWTDALGENEKNIEKDNETHTHTRDINKVKHKKQNENKEHKLRYVFKDTLTIDRKALHSLRNLVDNMENPRYNHEREHKFNEYLTHIVVKDDHGNELYPLVEEHNVFGHKIYIVPPVLYFNIFLTLFLVVFFQVIIHHKKVIEGGHFE